MTESTTETGGRYASIFRQDLFAEQIAVVTGGGSGIGRAIAHELAALGAHVVISGRKPEKLEAVVGEIEASGGRASFQIANIREPEEVDALCKSTVDDHGALHLLVNNAGGQFLASPEATTPKGFRAVVDTNLNGTFFMCQSAHRHWMRRNGGAIVNIVAEFWNGMPMMAHTGAARAGVANLTKSLALAWASCGIRINSVAPGLIRSSGLNNYPKAAIQGVLAGLSNTPYKRMGSESEVSAAVVFLLSPGAAFVSGDTLRVDGASSLYRQWVPIANHDKFERFEGLHLPADLPEGV